MRKVTFLLATLTALAGGIVIISASAHADDQGAPCGTQACGAPPPCTGPSCK